MNSNKKSPPFAARGASPPFNRQAGSPRQFKPAVAQLKTSVPAQNIKRPVAPPVYRSEAISKAAQPKMPNGAVNRKLPVAPPVYRPQPVPKVLQTKCSLAQTGQMSGQRLNAPMTAPKPATARPVAPPVYKPQPMPMVLQRKTVTTPEAMHMHPAGMRVHVLQMASQVPKKAGGGGGGGGGSDDEDEPVEAKGDGPGEGAGDEMTDAELLDLPEDGLDWLSANEKERLGILRSLKGKEDKQQDEDKAALASCRTEKDCVSWKYRGKTYHITIHLGTPHVTMDGSKKIHYFFQGMGAAIVSAQPTKEERGPKGTSKVFSKLPADVQSFIKRYWRHLIKK